MSRRGTLLRALAATAIALGVLTTGAPASATSSGPPVLSHPRVAGPDDWATYLHSPSRASTNPHDTALSPATAPNLTLEWSHRTNGSIASEPIVVDGTVYVGAWDGYEYALNASTGTVRWSTFLGINNVSRCDPPVAGITSTATWRLGVLYVGGGNGRWYALNANTGHVLWKVRIGTSSNYYNWASPLIVGNHAYVGIASFCDSPLVRGGLALVNLTSHTLQRTFYTVGPGQTGASVWGSPTYDARTNSVFFVTGNGATPTEPYGEAFVALNATTLALASYWSVAKTVHAPDSDFGTTPTLVAGARGVPLVVAANKNGLVYALNRTNLSAGPLWVDRVAKGGSCPQCGNGSISSGSYANATLYLAGGARTVAGHAWNGSVEAVWPGNGTVRWLRPLNGLVLPAVVTGDGLVVVGANQTLTVLNAATGSIVYRYTTGSTIYGPPSIAEGCVFVGSTDQSVYAFGLPNETCGGTGHAVSHGAVRGGGRGSSTPWVARRAEPGRR